MDIYQILFCNEFDKYEQRSSMNYFLYTYIFLILIHVDCRGNNLKTADKSTQKLGTISNKTHIKTIYSKFYGKLISQKQYMDFYGNSKNLVDVCSLIFHMQ